MCAIGKLGVDRSWEGLFAAAAQTAGSVERRCQSVATAALVNFELIIAVFRTQFVDANAQRLRFGDGKTEQLDIFCLLDQLHDCQHWRRLKGDSLCRGGAGQGCAAAIHFNFEHGQQTHVAIALRIDRGGGNRDWQWIGIGKGRVESALNLPFRVASGPVEHALPKTDVVGIAGANLEIDKD